MGFASRRTETGFASRKAETVFAFRFSRSSHASVLKLVLEWLTYKKSGGIGIGSRAGSLGVSAWSQGETTSLIRNFYLCLTARVIV